MLRKIALLTLPLFVLLGTLTAVVAFERQRTPAWQQVLNSYFAETRTTSFDVRTVAFAHATQPTHFRGEMASAYRLQEQWQWQIERLPFPADDLYCVLIERTPTTTANNTTNNIVESSSQLLYVAHHSDGLWRMGWLVYLGALEPFAPEVAADLAAVGCELKG